MPLTAKLIDQLRLEFGVMETNNAIRKAMAGEAGFFYAKENGMVFGTPDTTVTSVICWTGSGQCYRQDPEWMMDARAIAESSGIEIKRCNPLDVDDIHREAAALRKILRSHDVS